MAWSAAVVILLIPLFLMQVTDQVVWDVTDFAVLGALLVVVGLTFELAVKKTINAAYRAATGVALAAAFILIGVNGAVGVIGTAHDDGNLMFGGVLALGIIGSIITRFKPRGMARVMFVTALAQALVAVIALIAGFGSRGPIWPVDILISTVFFTALWLLSAWLFQKAAREQ